ncbi:hypothetical protein E0H26_07680 [Micromonospora zingiberis]|uniref:Copper resistance protein CopC n=1 Tax=Micromonospora zingiberis TaxID=2053011 RepID=A0A4R0GUL0_9ACTN|nr:hypothetical protein [Micromonospora zingiberis]TCB99258.1 hypothetical protein E0H26_07680 [Micromonospora zingiberis]
MPRIRTAVTAVLTGLLLAVLSATPAVAHGDKLKLTVAGDGADGVTIQATYADGHQLDTVVRLVLTATGAQGRTVGPVQLEPAAEGQGFYTTGPILSPGEWKVRVKAPAPYTGAASAQVQARVAQTPALAPVAETRDAEPARADRSTADAEAPGWWWAVGIGVAALVVVALTAPLLGRRRSRP